MKHATNDKRENHHHHYHKSLRQKKKEFVEALDVNNTQLEERRRHESWHE
jgi:hypothetical protein